MLRLQDFLHRLPKAHPDQEAQEEAELEQDGAIHQGADRAGLQIILLL